MYGRSPEEWGPEDQGKAAADRDQGIALALEALRRSKGPVFLVVAMENPRDADGLEVFASFNASGAWASAAAGVLDVAAELAQDARKRVLDALNEEES